MFRGIGKRVSWTWRYLFDLRNQSHVKISLISVLFWSGNNRRREYSSQLITNPHSFSNLTSSASHHPLCGREISTFARRTSETQRSWDLKLRKKKKKRNVVCNHQLRQWPACYKFSTYIVIITYTPRAYHRSLVLRELQGLPAWNVQSSTFNVL